MVDWLIVWEVTASAGSLVLSVMQELAKEGAKDYGKEFFKNRLGKVSHLLEKDVQKKAYGKAMKEFLALFQQQLEMADLEDDQIKNFEKPLNTFIKDEQVEPILGDAFDIDCQVLDTLTLAQSWQRLNLPPLPAEFNWEKLGKFYLRKTQEIIENSEKLRAVFLVKLQNKDSQNIQEIAGVKTDYNLDNYAEGLKKEYGHLKLECLDTTTYEQIKLWRMFVPQNVRRCKQFIPQLYELPKEVLQELVDRGEITQAELERKRQEYVNEKLYPVLNIVNSSEYRRTVILGDPGAGKSSLLQYLALNWAEKELSQRVLLPLPLLIELRIYARDKDEKKCKNILEFFHQGNLICHLNQLALDDKLKKGQALVLFDGLDEVFNPQLREEIVTDIKRFSIQYPQVQIIVTSRWLGYKAEELNHAGFEHFMIQDLDKDQIEDFIKRWHDLAFENRDDKTQKQERLQKAIKESKAIRQLAGNPLLLTMMAILNRTQELPRDRSKLYEKASEVLLHQWDFETKEGLIDPELKKYLYNIDLRDKRDILRLVASAMQAGEKGLDANLIYKEELENILTQYLEKTGINKRDASDLTDLIIKQLRYRNFILCSLGGNAFAFVHRTFLEYFCACEFYERFKNRGFPDGITLEELKTKVFGEHYSDPVWKEVLCLLMGMLSAEFPKEVAEELINYLIDMEEKDQEFAYLFLAADCYGELRNQSIYVKLSQRLLDSLQSLTKSSYRYADTDFKEKTVAKIGAIWQDHRTGWSVLQAIATERNVWYVQDQAVIQLSRIAKIHSEALVYLQEFARQGKSEAIEALATHWRDNPQTLPIIQQQANKGKSLAIQALVTHWRDNPQTLPIIQQQANKGQSKAIEALANHWRDNPQTLPIIQQQANKGEHRAIEALANHWRDHAQTLPIIQQLANKAEGEIIGLLTALARITIDSEIGAIIETILARTDVDAKIKEGFQEFLYYSNFRDWRNPD
ncbi:MULTISPECIES: NACHT domain-containing protein [unclassified Microcystis]|uniref:NACHT domain-containing protein n=1 Tax=unclassified Microcystis TaxID=2643300 RepID=UPI0022BAE47F|nr:MULTISPECIES: NACHT domain-containing protein [unclassified Microcystis]MCA2691227.1 NACHT domain-containing protein [Microcystis sp. M034S2]MCA2751350.1 NACHT domain-containing protein [Microcystis sp. M144S2]MCZ8202802.1 NACHT domain-containing protein [Microcystis sp. LE19-55.1A]MCZ8306891.1 NACHT domain-containing protein [Microcystis sp. LE19-98.1E]